MKTIAGYDWPEGHTKQVAYVSQDHHVHECCVGTGGAWQPTDLTMLSNAPLANSRFIVGYSWAEGGTKQVAFLGQDGHVHELWVSAGGVWQHADLTALTGAPPAIRVTTGYSWPEGNSKQIIFVGDDNHIHELFVECGQRWQHCDLTAITNAPIPGSNFMVGYSWSKGHSKQVSYVSQDGHIHELYMEAGRPWRHCDLTAMTNSPRAIDVMVGYEWLDGQCKQVAFVGTDGHIHELCMVIEGPWRHADLTTVANAMPAINVLTGFAWPATHSKQVAYVGQDGHIHEIYVEAGSRWTHVDLTALTNAPVTPITSIDGYAWSDGDSKQITYLNQDGNIRELWMPRTSSWTYSNLSMLMSAQPVRF